MLYIWELNKNVKVLSLKKKNKNLKNNGNKYNNKNWNNKKKKMSLFKGYSKIDKNKI